MSADKVSVLFREYMHLNPVSEGTEAIYNKAVERLIRRLGDKPVDSVSVIDAQRYHLFLTKRQVHGHFISPTTVNMQVRCVKAFFNWLVECEQIEKNPFKRIRMLKESPAAQKPFEDAEIERLIAAAPDERWKLIVVLAATTGMRRGEIMNLTVSDVNYIDGSMGVNPKTYTRNTWEWSIKDHESRVVPMTPLAEKFLLRIQAALPEDQPYLCVEHHRYRYLMELLETGRLTREHRQCPEQNFRRKFMRICQRAGVAFRKFHTLRGTCFSIMAENGLQPHELQRIAGHSSVQTTYQHYVRPRAALLEKARQTTYQCGRYWT